MYKVTRNRSLPSIFKITTYDSYERARQAVRKWLRSTKSVRGNVAISLFGFSIVQTD